MLVRKNGKMSIVPAIWAVDKWLISSGNNRANLKSTIFGFKSLMIFVLTNRYPKIRYECLYDNRYQDKQDAFKRRRISSLWSVKGDNWCTCEESMWLPTNITSTELPTKYAVIKASESWRNMGNNCFAGMYYGNPFLCRLDDISLRSDLSGRPISRWYGYLQLYRSPYNCQPNEGRKRDELVGIT